MKNISVEQEIKHKKDVYEIERRQNEKLDLLRAQKLVQDSVRENELIFSEALNENFSPE